MNWSIDLWASRVGGGLCLIALMGQRFFGISAWPMAQATGVINGLANVFAVRRFDALSREADHG